MPGRLGRGNRSAARVNFVESETGWEAETIRWIRVGILKEASHEIGVESPLWVINREEPETDDGRSLAEALRKCGIQRKFRG